MPMQGNAGYAVKLQFQRRAPYLIGILSEAARTSPVKSRTSIGPQALSHAGDASVVQAYLQAVGWRH